MLNEKKLWDEGADAYMHGKSENDNPFDPYDDAEHFSAWQHGYRTEKNYLENESQE